MAQTIVKRSPVAGCARLFPDEMWSFVPSPKQQRWLWQAIAPKTGQVLADVLSNHEDNAFLELKALLEPFGIRQFYTDHWGAAQRHLDPVRFTRLGKADPQPIQRQLLTGAHPDQAVSSQNNLLFKVDMDA